MPRLLVDRYRSVVITHSAGLTHVRVSLAYSARLGAEESDQLYWQLGLQGRYALPHYISRHDIPHGCRLSYTAWPVKSAKLVKSATSLLSAIYAQLCFQRSKYCAPGGIHTATIDYALPATLTAVSLPGSLAQLISSSSQGATSVEPEETSLLDIERWQPWQHHQMHLLQVPRTRRYSPKPLRHPYTASWRIHR